MSSPGGYSLWAKKWQLGQNYVSLFEMRKKGEAPKTYGQTGHWELGIILSPFRRRLRVPLFHLISRSYVCILPEMKVEKRVGGSRYSLLFWLGMGLLKISMDHTPTTISDGVMAPQLLNIIDGWLSLEATVLSLGGVEPSIMITLSLVGRILHPIYFNDPTAGELHFIQIKS